MAHSGSTGAQKSGKGGVTALIALRARELPLTRQPAPTPGRRWIRLLPGCRSAAGSPGAMAAESGPVGTGAAARGFRARTGAAARLTPSRAYRGPSASAMQHSSPAPGQRAAEADGVGRARDGSNFEEFKSSSVSRGCRAALRTACDRASTPQEHALLGTRRLTPLRCAGCPIATDAELARHIRGLGKVHRKGKFSPEEDAALQDYITRNVRPACRSHTRPAHYHRPPPGHRS